ncbi:MAG: cupin domain-containing protein, partial [Janthinobacterium lividum]
MAADTLDRLLTALAVRLHASSVCEVQQGWRLAFHPFETIVVHHALRGSGAMQVGNGPWLPFAPGSILVVPARETHAIGEAGPAARVVKAGDSCTMLADGLVRFVAGDCGGDTLLLCGAVSVSAGTGLGLFDLFREPQVEDLSGDARFRQMFGLMAAEVASPNFGTRAMTEALMKGCLIALLRRHLLRDGGSFLLPAL